MNIAIVIKDLISGGAQKQSLFLASILNKKYNVSYIVVQTKKVNGDYVKYLHENRINYYFLEGVYLKRFRNFSKIIKNNNIHLTFSFLFTDNLWCALFKNRYALKYTIGGIRNERIPSVKFFINRILNRYFQDYTIFNNYSGRNKFIKKGYIPNKSIVIQNCFINKNTKIKRTNNDEIKILSVGRFVAQKDYRTSIISFYYLIKNSLNKKIKYYIIGYGKEKDSIEYLINKLELNPFIELITDEGDCIINDHYKDSDIFLNTSLFEGTSNAIMEAMSFCLPIVATNVGDNNRLVIDGFNGFLIASKDYNDAANKLLTLVNSQDLRNTFGINGFEHLNKNFGLSRFQKDYFDLLNSIENIT